MNLSVAQLKKALAIRSKIDKFNAKINQLEKQLQGILGGEAVKTGVVRRKVKAKALRKIKRMRSKRGSLKKLLVKVFTKAGKPLHIDEILKELKGIGYKTSSKNPKSQLSVRLYSNKDFVRTAPGTFSLKSMAAKAGIKAKKVSKKSLRKSASVKPKDLKTLPVVMSKGQKPEKLL